MVHGTKARNGQLQGSEGQRSRSQKTEVRCGGLAEASFSTPWVEQLFYFHGNMSRYWEWTAPPVVGLRDVKWLTLSATFLRSRPYLFGLVLPYYINRSAVLFQLTTYHTHTQTDRQTFSHLNYLFSAIRLSHGRYRMNEWSVATARIMDRILVYSASACC